MSASHRRKRHDRRRLHDIMAGHGRKCARRSSDHGERFLNMCQSLGLCIADTWFPRRDIHHWTWYSNDGRTKKALDHIAISARWRSAVTNCRVYRGATLGNTDRRTLIATLRVRLKAEKSRRQASKFDSSKLQDPDIAESFSVSRYHKPLYSPSPQSTRKLRKLGNIQSRIACFSFNNATQGKMSAAPPVDFTGIL